MTQPGSQQRWRYWVAMAMLVTGLVPASYGVTQNVNLLFAFMTPLFVYTVFEVRRRSLEHLSLEFVARAQRGIHKELLYPQLLGVVFVLLSLLGGWAFGRQLDLWRVLLASFIYLDLWSLAYLLSFHRKQSVILWVGPLVILFIITLVVPIVFGYPPNLGYVNAKFFHPLSLWIPILGGLYAAVVAVSWIRLRRPADGSACQHPNHPVL